MENDEKMEKVMHELERRRRIIEALIDNINDNYYPKEYEVFIRFLND